MPGHNHDMKYVKMVDGKIIKKKLLGVISTKAVSRFLTESAKVYDEVIFIKPSLIAYTFLKGDSTPVIEYDGFLLNNFSMVFIYSINSEDRENILFLMDILDLAGVGICACRPKVLGKLDRLIHEHTVGFETTSYVISSYTAGEKLHFRLKENHYPLISKPINGSGGEGIEKISDAASLLTYLSKYFSKHSKPVILEPFFKIIKEWRVYLADGHVIASYEKIQSTESFKFNLAQGGSLKKTEAEDEDNIKLHINNRLIKPYDSGFIGVDIGLIENGNLYIIEYNMQSGWSHVLEVTGINVIHELFLVLHKRSA